MPPNYERNFGFTQFALELNELTAELKRSLPSTDTRLRPDQRSVPGGSHSGSARLLPPHGGLCTDLGLYPSFLVLPQGDGTCLRAELDRDRSLGLIWGAPEGGAVPLMAVWVPRYLEEGNIQAAEAQKRRIEQLQRDRRKVMEENNIVHQARFFRCLHAPSTTTPCFLSPSPLVPCCFEWGLWCEAASSVLDAHPSPSPAPFPQAADGQQREGVVGD